MTLRYSLYSSSKQTNQSYIITHGSKKLSGGTITPLQCKRQCQEEIFCSCRKEMGAKKVDAQSFKWCAREWELKQCWEGGPRYFFSSLLSFNCTFTTLYQAEHDLGPARCIECRKIQDAYQTKWGMHANQQQNKCDMTLVGWQYMLAEDTFLYIQRHGYFCRQCI